MYLLWNLPFFKLILPKTSLFFLFSNLGLIMAQESSNHVNCFMTGDVRPHAILSQNVGEGPGETPPALRCLFYLIRSLLTDIKYLAKN